MREACSKLTELVRRREPHRGSSVYRRFVPSKYEMRRDEKLAELAKLWAQVPREAHGHVFREPEAITDTSNGKLYMERDE